MSGTRIPAVLQRLQVAFDGAPIVLANVRTHDRPGPRSLRVLADHLAALANEPDGGVLVLGIDRELPSRILGVADPAAWTAAIDRAAAELDPAPGLEVEVGEEQGRAIVAVRVDHGPVRRRDVEDGRASPLLAGVPGSSVAWLDPSAISRIVPGWVAHPSLEARSALTRAGLLAADGRSITRVGLLLAGRPEHRARADGLALTTGEGTTFLRRGWVLLAADLRAQCRTEAIDLVVDLVTHMLVRTASSSAPAPMAVDVGPGRLVIETSSPIRDDSEIARRMARWTTWQREGWRATAQRLGAEVRWAKARGGLRVPVHFRPNLLGSPRRTGPALRVAVRAGRGNPPFWRCSPTARRAHGATSPRGSGGRARRCGTCWRAS